MTSTFDTHITTNPAWTPAGSRSSAFVAGLGSRYGVRAMMVGDGHADITVLVARGAG